MNTMHILHRIASPASRQAQHAAWTHRLLVCLLSWGLMLSALVSFPAHALDTAWVDDATPVGATLGSDSTDLWTWITTSPVPFSGTLAHQSALAAGEHQHYFLSTPPAGQLSVGVGEKLFTYIYLDPVNPPTEVMLQWHDTLNSWEHRAYWGANNIPWGIAGTVSLNSMGALPATGQWVRLEVPASAVGLEGSTLDGMAFTLFDGRATWDLAGKSSATAALPTAVYYIYADHLNTPRLITNTNNAPVWRWDSDPYGTDMANNQNPSGVGAFNYNLRFPGQYYDQETGLNYNYFRDYDPSTGRYVESDPIGLAGGLNTYAYTEGNPVSYVDPSGLCLEDGCAVEIGIPLFIRWATPRVAAALAGAALANSASQSNSSTSSSAVSEQCKPDDKNPDCHKASPWEMKQAGIDDAHAYKREHGAVPESHFDICKCKDGSIRIARVGQCGKTSNFWN